MLDTLTLGDTLNFLTTVDGFSPVDGWVLKYRLIPRASGSPIDITASAEGADFRVQVSAATTGGWGSGTFSWASWVEKAGEVYSVDSGSIQLLPNPRTASTLDSRTDAQIALDQARAAFKAWTPTTRSYQIGFRRMEFAAPADILAVIAYWEGEVEKEQAAAAVAKGLPDPRKILVRSARW